MCKILNITSSEITDELRALGVYGNSMGSGISEVLCGLDIEKDIDDDLSKIIFMLKAGGVDSVLIDGPIVLVPILDAVLSSNEIDVYYPVFLDDSVKLHKRKLYLDERITHVETTDRLYRIGDLCDTVKIGSFAMDERFVRINSNSGNTIKLLNIRIVKELAIHNGPRSSQE